MRPPVAVGAAGEPRPIGGAATGQDPTVFGRSSVFLPPESGGECATWNRFTFVSANEEISRLIHRVTCQMYELLIADRLTNQLL
jgi:hypothetical protein